MSKNLLLITGKSKTGKSSSLRNIKNPEGVMYLGTESGKDLPFKCEFDDYNIIDPYQIFEAFEKAETMPEIHTIIIDSITFLMDQFETQYVLTATNKMTAWGDFAQYFKKLLQQTVAESSKNVIMTAHTLSTLNESTMEMETCVPIKGSLKNNGCEAYFTTVISTKKVNLKDLEPYKSYMLNITEDEELYGYKHCFQVKHTKETIHERIGSPIGMFNRNETYIDNDANLVIERMREFYE